MTRRNRSNEPPRVEHRELPLAVLLAGRAEYNPRVISPQKAASLKSSIEEFGLVEPIVWNRRTSRVVGGHQRLAALEALGSRAAVQVSVVDLDEARERVLNVRLNNDRGDWDRAKLAETVAWLHGAHVDVADLGFDQRELAELEEAGRRASAELARSTATMPSVGAGPAVTVDGDERKRCPTCGHVIGARTAAALVGGRPTA